MLLLKDHINHIPGVGLRTGERLGKLGLTTIHDLLNHFPTRYEDFSRLRPISELGVGEKVTVAGRVQLISARRARGRRLSITEALVSDDTGTLKAVWFNQPYLAQSLHVGDRVLLAGKLVSSNYGLQLEHPTWELEERGGIHTGRLVPQYPLTANLTQRQLRNVVARILPAARTLPDWLPAKVVHWAKLMPLGQAVETLHFPNSREELRQARMRVTFDELFLMHLKSRLARQSLLGETAPKIPFTPQTKTFVEKLPWPLTADQRVAAWEIIKGLGGNQPMLRLLQGDVGSGKTIVAGLAALNAAAAGWQTALLAPTEILAYQHFVTLGQLFKNWPVRIGLLSRGHHEATGKTGIVTAAKLKAMSGDGKLDILVGTHSLLQNSVAFRKLGLIIVDEQHRFGVLQRQALIQNSSKTVPHFLSLSATPIPRSLALTLFGDLDISLLHTLPKGRQPITTAIIPPDGRAGAYKMIRREVNNGNLAFIVCPLIDESDAGGVRAATAERERLHKEVFPDIALGLLHGKMKPHEKRVAMQNFQSGATPILVCTSVVEVGVDVPKATIIAIEGAERFGLAQLHQLRGRVGRSDLASHCLLMAETNETASNPRLVALTRYTNGFNLAEFDLKTRGPGDLLGSTQSGFLRLRFAELADAKLLTLVRSTVDYFLKADPNLANLPSIKAKLGDLDVHPE